MRHCVALQAVADAADGGERRGSGEFNANGDETTKRKCVKRRKLNSYQLSHNNRK